MRIGQISHRYYPSVGGIENYVRRLKGSLEKMGHEVTVYTTDFGIPRGAGKEKGVFYCKTNFAIHRNPFSRELLQKLRGSEDDLYHLHSPWFFPSLFGARLLDKKPKVMTVHGARVGVGPVLFTLSLLYRPFARRVLHKMDKIIALTKSERDYLLRRFKLSRRKVVVVPNGVEVESFRARRETAEEFVRKHGLREGSFKVLYVGRIIPEKNPDKLISAVTKHMEGKDVEVIMVGDGSPDYIAKLKRASEDKVHILGNLNFEELVAAYRTSDLFVFSGLLEGLPTVILEAMACGLPVLTTPVAGIPDVIVEGVNGMHLNLPIREDDIASKIGHFMELGDSDLRRMGKANVRKVRAHYNWEDVVDKILDVYNQVLEM